jgi:hypothetical protein
MKKLLLLMVLSFLFIYPSQSQDFSIVGTWQLVSLQIIRNGVTVTKITDSTKTQNLKSWSKESFLFAGKIINNNNTSYSCGSGTYNLKGNQYSENIKVHSNLGLEGKTINVYLDLKGDTLSQILPVNNIWDYDKNNCYIEKYIRVN